MNLHHGKKKEIIKDDVSMFDETVIFKYIQMIQDDES